MSLERITVEGKTFVLVPDQMYNKMLSDIEDKEDLLILNNEIKNPTQTIPGDVFHKIILNNENPIKVYREYRGFTQAYLAELSCVSEAYISQLESNKRTGTTKILKNIAKALDVNIDDIA